MTFNNASVTGRPVSDRVSFNCLDTVAHPETPNITRTDCPYGLRAQIQFQSCWDGVNNYLPGNAHVDYMSQIDNGVCSDKFPVQLVHLFYEVLYGVNQIDQSDGGRFVFVRSTFASEGLEQYANNSSRRTEIRLVSVSMATF